MALNHKLVALIILDGWGVAPASQSNAVALAKKPFFDSLIKNYPAMLLQASGLSVGLPVSEVGNSEVGHANIGSGILRYQSLPRINKSISTGQFFKLPPLIAALEQIKQNKNSRLHFIGLIGNGGVHSSQEHFEALINFAKAAGVRDNVFLHLFLDGRDAAKDSGKEFVAQAWQFCQKNKTGQIASLAGRFWGMDRNKNWDRIQKSYNAIVLGQAEKIHREPLKAIEEAYAQNIFDEEFPPTVFVDKKGQPLAQVVDGDVIIFFNFRPDRARQLTQALVGVKFDKFPRQEFPNLMMITFTEYEHGLPVKVLFEPETIDAPLAKIFSDYNLSQLHLAETEKYAHVTFFLNGMKEEPFVGEDRILVPSPGVNSYDVKPEMSAFKVTDEFLKAVKSEKHFFLAVNYANPDMVAHTGNLKATIKAVETVDQCLAKVVPEIIKRDGLVFLVADHGNAEELFNLANGDIDKEHNFYPVPFIVAGNRFAGQPNPELTAGDISLLTPVGILSDVAPTILELCGLSKAPEMTGTCLLK
jgi:2,3-bisphosphoglycerate-independent phosphoglycerate mutase